MLAKKVTVRLENGLQACPAALFVQSANLFKSHLTLEKDGHVANVKSIMGVMSLAPAYGESFLLRAEGEDEMDALAALASFVENEQMNA
ncbi:HPr family phosphocarrier protein [Sporolactobacillus laevolacticus]|uniref:Phosphate ABC transporter permease n=1 Tax=Sporolactobacillus laevolacticus DSM 442 TaxID=1395513 RepID=V6IWI5_9BACL|nr:HPr family phosphocarrier protein [Sporolactobacillus laevolacticus]EST11580.1 phosphate ABC transporter permease [Sporolactobacillus laevolacticus DSM 442]